MKNHSSPAPSNFLKLSQTPSNLTRTAEYRFASPTVIQFTRNPLSKWQIEISFRGVNAVRTRVRARLSLVSAIRSKTGNRSGWTLTSFAAEWSRSLHQLKLRELASGPRPDYFCTLSSASRRVPIYLLPSPSLRRETSSSWYVNYENDKRTIISRGYFESPARRRRTNLPRYRRGGTSRK